MQYAIVPLLTEGNAEKWGPIHESMTLLTEENKSQYQNEAIVQPPASAGERAGGPNE